MFSLLFKTLYFFNKTFFIGLFYIHFIASEYIIAACIEKADGGGGRSKVET